MKTLIIKLGGASVSTPERFSSLAELIIERSEKYEQLAIVVSAMGDMTDYLIDLAYKVHPNPPRREYDMLVSVGERISISLLAMALALKGKEAVSFTGSQSGIITCNHHSEAKILNIKPQRLLKAFQAKKIVIVAGFQGVSQEGEITTLGRGGSDTTAVALAVALQAERVEFLKDVEGIYSEDPKKSSSATLYKKLNYGEAQKVIYQTGCQVLHPRALNLAQKNSVPLSVRSFYTDFFQEGTSICDQVERPLVPIYEL